jgi:hypothetical protein
VAPSAGVEVIEATGGTTIVVDGAALDDELGSLLAPLLWLSGHRSRLTSRWPW